MSKDYYKSLNVDKNASQDEIKKAFRKLAHEHHPDKAGGNEAKFKEINEAYQILGDTKKRAQYDQFGSNFDQGGMGGGFQNGFNGQNFNFNMDDLGEMFGGFGDVFGFGDNGRQRARNSQGHDIQVAVTIDFLEAIFGVEKELQLNKTNQCSSCHGNGAEPGTNIESCDGCKGTGRVIKVQRTILGNIQVQATCDKCHGEGKIYKDKCKKCGGGGVVKELQNIKVKIPAGIDDGQSIRLNGQGEAGQKGGRSGDLYLQVRVHSNRDFKRDGFNIHSEIQIGFTQAALGTKVLIKTVDGEVTLKIPEGTQSGKTYVLRDHGVPKLQGRGRGDHLVKVTVVTPTSLTRQQRKILEELGI
ncbi:MAG: molecular chaperone DnaJ [bacterium]